MTKSDLKAGMVVELRDENMFLVLPDYYMGECTYVAEAHIAEDLTYPICNDLDIVKVYKRQKCTVKDVFNKNCLILIWERQEFKYQCGLNLQPLHLL